MVGAHEPTEYTAASLVMMVFGLTCRSYGFKKTGKALLSLDESEQADKGSCVDLSIAIDRIVVETWRAWKDALHVSTRMSPQMSIMSETYCLPFISHMAQPLYSSNMEVVPERSPCR